MSKTPRPWDDAPPRRAEPAAEKKLVKGRPGEKVLVTPGMIKWLFFGMLGLLFAAAVAIMFENLSGKPAEDPAEAMRRAMGISSSSSSSASSAPDASAAELNDALALLAAPDASSRVEGLLRVMKLNAAQAGPQMGRFLADPDPTVRSTAAKLCGEYKVPGAHNWLVPMLSDPDLGVRTAVSEGLLPFKDEPGFLYLLSTPLSSPNPDVVIAGLSIWKRIASQDITTARNMIVTPLNSSDPSVLAAAMECLSAFSADDVKPLDPYLRSIAARWNRTALGQQAKGVIARYQPPEGPAAP